MTSAPDAPAATDYQFVDTAVGGVANRNKIRDLREWTPPAGEREVYTTWMRFTEKFRNYTATNLRTKGNPDPLGKPSVADYDGDGCALFVPLDIDVEGDRAEAHRRALAVLQTIENYALNIDLGAVRCYFSGNKGFSLEMPASLFGGFAPGPCLEVAARVKAIAQRIAADASTGIDQRVYDPTRLWRVPNSQHGKSGLYKIPLTAADVRTMSIGEIEELAKQPRAFEFPDDSEWSAVPALVALNSAATPGSDGAGEFKPPLDDAALLANGAPQGERDNKLYALASKYRRDNVPIEEALAKVLQAARKCKPPFPDMDAIQKVTNAYNRYKPDPVPVWIEDPPDGATAPAEDEDESDGDQSAPKAKDTAPPVAERAIRVDGHRFEQLVGGATRAMQLSNEPPTTFVRAGALTRVCRDEHDRPVIASHTADSLRVRMGEAAAWRRKAGSGFVDVSPPTDVARSILALGEWKGRFPALDGITQSPILHADGSIHRTNGYDPVSRMWYAPAVGFTLSEIPETPTTGDVADAVLLIDDLIVNFPFKGDADRATFWAALMTATLRPLIDGPTPLFIFDKPRAGTGASLLAEIVALIATGEPARMSQLSPDRGGEEIRKSITSALIAGDQMIIYDNVDSAISSGHLAAALTARVWQDRILGKSETVRLPVRVSWLATGNNIVVRGDIARRSLVCRLDAQVDRPWERTGFRHPNLLGHVAAHRGKLLAALLTIARAWIQAGRPGGGIRPLGSFEDWTHVIGGVLARAGVVGLLSNMDEFYEAADEDAGEWGPFLAALYEGAGWGAGEPFTVAQLVRQLNPAVGAEPGGDLDLLRETLPGALAEHIGRPTLQNRIGQALKAKAEARYSGHRLVKAGKQHGVMRWRVKRDDPPPKGGAGGPGGADYGTPCRTESPTPNVADGKLATPGHPGHPPPAYGSPESSEPPCPDCGEPLKARRCFTCKYALCACGARTQSPSHKKCDACLGEEAAL